MEPATFGVTSRRADLLRHEHCAKANSWSSVGRAERGETQQASPAASWVTPPANPACGLHGWPVARGPLCRKGRRHGLLLLAHADLLGLKWVDESVGCFRATCVSVAPGCAGRCVCAPCQRGKTAAPRDRHDARCRSGWCRRKGSNLPRPRFQRGALPDELRRPSEPLRLCPRANTPSGCGVSLHVAPAGRRAHRHRRAHQAWRRRRARAHPKWGEGAPAAWMHAAALAFFLGKDGSASTGPALRRFVNDQLAALGLGPCGAIATHEEKWVEQKKRPGTFSGFRAAWGHLLQVPGVEGGASRRGPPPEENGSRTDPRPDRPGKNPGTAGAWNPCGRPAD